MSKLIITVVAWLARRAWIFYLIVFATMAAGLVTDRFVGGEPAWIAGRIQFIGLVAFLFFAFVYLIFRKYRGESRVPSALITVFLLLTTISIYFIAFTAVSIAKHVS